MKISARNTTLIFLGIFMILGLSFLSQDKRKNEIRILIDRAPNTLEQGQNPDGMARRILPLIQELHYSVQEDRNHEDFVLRSEDPTKPTLHFSVARDDLTRGILLVRNRTDVLYDTLSLSKSEWFRRGGAPILTAPGAHLSYLGFNLKHPALKERAVREAIALALPIDEWIKHKYFNWVSKSPEAPSELNLEKAKLLLDTHGFVPNDSTGIRLRLRYLTTPVREGSELALLTRDALRKIGIELEVVPLETSLFFSRIKRGDFELFGSRMLRSSINESVADYFKANGTRNYFAYENAALEHQLKKSQELPWSMAKSWVNSDLPMIPLFTWNHGLLLSQRVHLPSSASINWDDSFRFLANLQIK